MRIQHYFDPEKAGYRAMRDPVYAKLADHMFHMFVAGNIKPFEAIDAVLWAFYKYIYETKNKMESDDVYELE